ncbi:SGNH/GDSL hydrolase family protein [Flammeovirgaceae bacterium SG7u.111]|nr:SGNH/GDSL hydrolase family protein [Flammeovirgaceae bacterium SG7u.132]WPO36177.1 SGNH/GDSL hydrolase family protein [Flammeovirgaceae bacterium SG7u.111]
MAKTILCYGDSNTWGYNPHTKGRYSFEKRWSSVLQASLGSSFRVIAEGLNGRTTVWDDPMGAYKNGKIYLIPCLHSHKPIDVVIIKLGTNDLKKQFCLTASEIANGAKTLVEMVIGSECGPESLVPKVLLIAPAPLATVSGFAEMFEGGEKKSKLFGKAFSKVAEELGCYFLDAGKHIHSSEKDGVHLDEEMQLKLGKAVADKVKVMHF